MQEGIVQADFAEDYHLKIQFHASKKFDLTSVSILYGSTGGTKSG